MSTTNNDSHVLNIRSYDWKPQVDSSPANFIEGLQLIQSTANYLVSLNGVLPKAVLIETLASMSETAWMLEGIFKSQVNRATTKRATKRKAKKKAKVK
jgi:hypothetical protein